MHCSENETCYASHVIEVENIIQPTLIIDY